MRIPLLAAISLLALPAPSVAQRPAARGTPLVLGERITLESKVLGEPAWLNVWVPTPRGDNTADRYVVIYVLDGPESLMPTAAAVDALMWEEDMPPAIVVSVQHRRRERYYTPPVSSPPAIPRGFTDIGGADTFIEFLAREAVPYVDAHYPTLPYRVLMGHSLGGLLVLHAMATQPSLFAGYVALDPSAWWDGRAVLVRLVNRLRASPMPIPRLIVAEGASDAVRPAWPVVRDAIGSRGISAYFAIPGESHTGMQYAGRHRALRALFAEYVPGYRRDAGKATRTALDSQYRELGRRWGYAVEVPRFALAELARRRAKNPP